MLPAPTTEGNTPHSALPLLQILRFTIHHSQLVGLHSLVALGNRFYPDFIWWARTQEVYPDGVVGVLKRALAIPNSRACRNSVVIGDWILSLKGTTWWNQRPFAVGNNSVLLFCFRNRTTSQNRSTLIIPFRWHWRYCRFAGAVAVR